MSFGLCCWIARAGGRLSLGALCLSIFAVHFPRPAMGSEIVISQIYGGGGNSGAPYHNDFVELFNRGTNLVTISNWSVQYASSSGSNWLVTVVSGSIAPGRYYLIQQGSGGSNGLALPAPDASGTISMSSSAGKVALVAGTTALAGNCPAGMNVMDLVGYGTAADCSEGSGSTPNPGNAIAALRGSGGCQDANDNRSDFYTGAPSPRNSASAANPCAIGPPVPIPLHAIQGADSRSPFAGQFVTTTTNIVTALVSDGFFIQSREGEADGDAATSEGVFVSTPAGLPSVATVGHAVVVSGIVSEQRPASDTTGPTRTEIINSTTSMVSPGNTLPPPALLAMADANPAGLLDSLERFEGMRVRVNSLTTIGPTEGFLNESSGTGVSDGVFYGVITGVMRPFREPGIAVLDPLPLEAPAGVPRFDRNPERLRVDSNAQPGASRLEVTSGAVVSNLVGVIDFDLRLFTILPDPASGVSVMGNIGAIPVPASGSNELTLASFNLQRFYDTTDDPAVSDVILTPGGFETRLRKASLAIRNVLRAPDILGVVEMENLATLESLAARIDSDAAAAGQARPGYMAYLVEGNDIGGIDVGFLVKTPRLAVLEVTQLGKSATYVNPIRGQPELLHDRPPLMLRISVPASGASTPFELTVILVHLRSLLNIDDPAEGARVRAKRKAQAEFVANVIQQRQNANPMERTACLGDFNAFPFNDGYVDVLGTIMGRPAPADEVTAASADLVEPDLVNLLSHLPASQRYSYVIDGDAEAIDHLLVNAPLSAHVGAFGFARCNADFPESFRNTPGRPERISDHDAPVACFTLAPSLRFESLAREVSGDILLRWLTAPGVTSSLQAAATPALPTAWMEIGSVVADNAGRAAFTDTNANVFPQRFYRLLER